MTGVAAHCRNLALFPIKTGLYARRRCGPVLAHGLELVTHPQLLPEQFIIEILLQTLIFPLTTTGQQPSRLKSRMKLRAEVRVDVFDIIDVAKKLTFS
jgi:hypothetical protein